MRLQFLGAAQNVTGSRHLLEANGTSLLVDCGLYQERQFKDRNWEPFSVPPGSIDAVFLTHAHLDHCGLLPKLVKEGFKGKVYCTAATADLAKIILLDSAHIQAEDVEKKLKRHKRENRTSPYPLVPLYTVDDVEACFSRFTPLEYQAPVRIAEGIEAKLCEAGHVLGSSLVKISIRQDGECRSVLFSGDLGRPNRPIVRDPAMMEEADYVLVEGTYGDRVHGGPQDTKQALGQAILTAVKAGGNIVVPSFALERSQDILFYISELVSEGAIPHLMVFLDSPMAAAITEVFRRHIDLYDDEMRQFMRTHRSPFDFPGLTITESSEQSKAINQIKGTAIIISGSGMCTAGRIKHHLINNIARRESTIMFVGYQAIGTLGRLILDGHKTVRILGEMYPVKAKVVQVHGFSAHADKVEILTWLKTAKRPPRKVFVVHGEAGAALAFGEFLRKETGWAVDVPAYQDQAVLD